MSPGRAPRGGAAFGRVPELLRAIAEEGSLEGALSRLPGLGAEEARGLLVAAADRLGREAAPQGELFGGVPAAAATGRTAPTAARTVGTGRQTSGGAAAAPGAGGPSPRPRSGTAADPRLEKLRVYCDGAARGNPGPAGAGAVLTDESGQVLFEAGRFLGRQTNNVAEYEGLLLGLRAALRFGAREVEVRADSELMVRQLTGRYKVKAPHLKPLYEQAVDLLSRFDRHRIKHVPRAQNAAADEMSNRAIDERLDD